jgi:signal transduction histidine kinase
MGSDVVADFIRTHRTRIATLWAREVSSPVIEHVGDFLDGLADWIEGKTERGEHAFAAVVEGHALQRLGYGVGIETLTREYGKLRVVLVRELLELPSTEDVRASLLRLHEGMDRAASAAIQRYAACRDEVRERFIGILGHDLRDPLSTIRVSAGQLAGDPKLVEEDRLVAARIRRACDRMQRMIDDVLDFARGHLGGGIPANPAHNDMGEICRAAVDEIAAANPGRVIAVRTDGDLRADLDRDRVIQAITNLVTNAILHGTGPIEVRARRAGASIITEVTSHGDVIPDDTLRRIFDPFARGDPTELRHGLGLGLYIVQQIALAHGAACEVSSTEIATTFAIRWPRRQASRRSA